MKKTGLALATLFFELLDYGWSQSTKLTGSRYPVAFPDIIACQIDVLPD